MSYAALCSGICLAQAGLGAVHGLASPLGAQYPVPHGVACGATLIAATRMNIAALEERDPESRALSRYAVAGWMFSGRADAARQMSQINLFGPQRKKRMRSERKRKDRKRRSR